MKPGSKKQSVNPDAGINQSSPPRSVGQGFQRQDGCTTHFGLQSSKLSGESDVAILVSLVGFPSQGTATILTQQWEIAEASLALTATNLLLIVSLNSLKESWGPQKLGELTSIESLVKVLT
jgi:hypothetical protein